MKSLKFREYLLNASGKDPDSLNDSSVRQVSTRRRSTNEKVSGRPFPYNTSLSEAQDFSKVGVLRVYYSKKVKRVTLQRYLVSKIAYFPNETTLADVTTLYDNLLHLQDLSEKNKDFKNKFGKDLESLAKILKSYKFNSNGLKTIVKLSKDFKSQLENFLYPKRNLPSVQKHVSNKYQLEGYKPLGIPTSQLKPKAYVGKGYTDKGTVRDPSYDGSPTWQEVANHRGKIYEI